MFERSSLRCPACDYDVGPSLEAGIRTCSECGGAVSPETCQRTVENLPSGTRWLVMCGWLLPPGAVVLALWAEFPPWILATLVAASVVPIYAAWVWVERWIGTPRPLLTAVILTAGVLILDLWIVLALLFAGLLAYALLGT